MTPVGHTLTGLALGYAFLPSDISKSRRASWLACSAIFANAPDLPLPFWGHDRYDISHSIFTTAIAVSLCVLLAWLVSAPNRKVDKKLILVCTVAWFSHLLLDTFYNHGQGLAVFWPISERRIALPIQWFSTMRVEHLISMHNLKVFAIEGGVYGVLLLTAVTMKKLRGPRDQTPEN